MLKGLGAAAGGKSVCQMMAELQQAMGGPHAGEILADPARFTDA